MAVQNNVCPNCADGGVCCSNHPAEYYDGDCHRRIYSCLNVWCHVNGWSCGGGDLGVTSTDWRGYLDQPGDVCPACGTEPYEICNNTVDDDCDGELDEDGYGECVVDVPCDGKWDHASAQCDGTCRMRGGPVDLWQNQIYVGPHELVRVRSDQGGSADLAFEVLFDSIRGEWEDDGRMKGDGTEDPRILDVSPGFRHRFGDRLIANNLAFPTKTPYVVWESMRGRVHFYPNGSGWKAEPGVNAALLRSGATWRLLTPDHDVLEFVDTPNGTSNHPHLSYETHVRLRNIYPGGTPARRILLLYEDDATDVDGGLNPGRSDGAGREFADLFLFA